MPRPVTGSSPAVAHYAPVVLMSLAAVVTAPLLVVAAVHGGWGTAALLVVLVVAAAAVVSHALARPAYSVHLLTAAVVLLVGYGAVFTQWGVVPAATGSVVATLTVALGLAAAFLGWERRVAAGRLLTVLAGVAVFDRLLFAYMHPGTDAGGLALLGPAGAAAVAALLAGAVLLSSGEAALRPDPRTA